MLIISVKDNQNNRGKRNAKKKEKNRIRGTEATAKGWEINDFVEHLSKVFSNWYVKALWFLSRI